MGFNFWRMVESTVIGYKTINFILLLNKTIFNNTSIAPVAVGVFTK